jgi:hypothetical protein
LSARKPCVCRADHSCLVIKPSPGGRTVRAGTPEPERLARQLQMVYDGDGMVARADGDASITGPARAVTQALIQAAGVVEGRAPAGARLTLRMCPSGRSRSSSGCKSQIQTEGRAT